MNNGKPLRIGSLFAGIGGIEYGFHLANFETTGYIDTKNGHIPIRKYEEWFAPAWFVEWEAFPQRILRQRFPGTPVYGDVTQVDFRSVPPVDILTGGFPCQDISNAGKRAGITGSRSSLWKNYCGAIRILRPKYALIENVGALSSRGLNVVLGDLAEIGYDAEWHCVSASSVGAPHRRERIFIIAKRGEGRYSSDRDAEGSGNERDGAEARTEQDSNAEEAGKLPYSDSERCGSWRDNRERGYVSGDGERNNEKGESERSGRLLGAGKDNQDVAELTTRCIKEGGDVSNANGQRCRGRIHRTGEDRARELSVEEAGDGNVLRSQVEGCCGDGGAQCSDVSDSNHSRQQDRTEQYRGESAQGGAWFDSLGGPNTLPNANKFGLQRVRTKRKQESNEYGRQKTSYWSDSGDGTIQFSWSVESGLGGEAYGIPAGVDGPRAWDKYWEDGVPKTSNRKEFRVDRVKALGNAVVPQVIEVFARAIKAEEKRKRGEQ